jgi:hypothetical protein
MDIKTVEAGRGASWLLDGFDYFKADPLPWLGTVLILLIINAISAKIVILGLAFGLVFPVVVAGLLLGCRAHDTGGNFRINHLVEGFSGNVAQLVLSGVLLLVAFVIAGFIAGLIGGVMFGGTAIGGGEVSPFQVGAGLLFVVLIMAALSIPILMAGWFAAALIVFNKLDAVQALQESFKACLRNIVPFLVYGLVGLALAVLATIPFGLGWFILMPMTFASIYIAYKDIFGAPAAGTA